MQKLKRNIHNNITFITSSLWALISVYWLVYLFNEKDYYILGWAVLAIILVLSMARTIDAYKQNKDDLIDDLMTLSAKNEMLRNEMLRKKSR